MGIWIRSQDKEVLCECSSFTVSINYSGGIEDGFSIDGSTTDGTVLDLGIYSSEKQAIEVMDIMQKHIEDSPKYTCSVSQNEWNSYNQKVFQMPQDADMKGDKDGKKNI